MHGTVTTVSSRLACDPLPPVTDFCYLAGRHSASAFQSGGFVGTAGDWRDDLTQICLGTQ